MIESINKDLYKRIVTKTVDLIEIELINNQAVMLYNFDYVRGVCNVCGLYEHDFERVKFKDVNSVIVFSWFDSPEIECCSIADLISIC